jgi:CHAT domain-containing protein
MVASQWKVNSHSTAEIMVRFHQNLLMQNPPISKAVALQQAALKLRNSSVYEHPFYWAPFIIVGKNDF